MAEQIITDHTVEALKTAASWPGADRATLVTLATVLAATGADADGAAFFGELAANQSGQVLPLALIGFFAVRSGQDIHAGLARLDEAASKDLGLPQYYQGLALAGLPPEAGKAGQAVADLEFVLAVRDQFPSAMIRAVHDGLAAAHAALGNTQQASQAGDRTPPAARPLPIPHLRRHGRRGNRPGSLKRGNHDHPRPSEFQPPPRQSFHHPSGARARRRPARRRPVRCRASDRAAARFPRRLAHLPKLPGHLASRRGVAFDSSATATPPGPPAPAPHGTRPN